MSAGRHAHAMPGAGTAGIEHGRPTAPLLHLRRFVPTDSQRQAFAVLRIAFGLLWLINAWFQLQSAITGHFMAAWVQAAAGQAPWLHDYVLATAQWVNDVGTTPAAVVMVALDVLLALSLITGVYARLFSWIGLGYSLFLWSTLEAFGAPYGAGTTDPGTGIIYAVAFAFLLATRPWRRLRLGGAEDPHPPASPAASGPDPVALARVLFGLLWAFDAFWKWHPYFFNHFLDFLAAGQQHQPAWIVAYIGLFVHLIRAVGPHLAALLTAILETLIAVSLITGRWLALFAPLGALFSLGIWTTAEGWGGPYARGVTGSPDSLIGTAIIYFFVFLFVIVAYDALPRRRARAASGG